MVRARLLVMGLTLGCWLSTGCSSMSNTEKGVGVGGLLGAGVGSAIGAAHGDTGTGAVVGGLLGAGIGGLAGADEDARERADIRRTAAEAQATPSPVGLTDVVQLTQRGVSDVVIVNQIRQSRSTYRLSSADIEMLKANHVSDRVIIEMQNSQSRIGSLPPKTVIVRETAPTTVIYDHGPDWCGPVYVAPPRPRFGVHVDSHH